jgi:hypothetical protein
MTQKTRGFVFGAALAMTRSEMIANRQLLNLAALGKQYAEEPVTASTFTRTRADRKDKSI